MLPPFADQSQPPVPSDPGGGPYGWIVAAVVTVLGAISALWTVFRKSKTEDTTTALTHANTIIKGYERYVKLRDSRIEALEKAAVARDEYWRAEIAKVHERLACSDREKQKCLMKVDWLYGALRQNRIDLPAWPDELDGAENEPKDGP